MDVLTHLTKEHRDVEALLEKLADSDEGPEREATLAELEMSLGVHMAVEERFVYPIVQRAIGEEDSEEGDNEHNLTRQGLTTMRNLVDKPGFGAAVDATKAGIAHHVKEEEEEMFPELREKAGAEVDALPEPEELERIVKVEGSEITKAELLEQARDAGIEGRSTMSADQLRAALTGD